MFKVKISYGAENTWLEPYIGWEFELISRGPKNSIIRFTQHPPENEMIEVANNRLEFLNQI